MNWTIGNWFLGLTTGWREVWYRLTYRRAFSRVHIRIGHGVHVGYYVGGALIGYGRKLRDTRDNDVIRCSRCGTAHVRKFMDVGCRKCGEVLPT